MHPNAVQQCRTASFSDHDVTIDDLDIEITYLVTCSEHPRKSWCRKSTSDAAQIADVLLRKGLGEVVITPTLECE